MEDEVRAENPVRLIDAFIDKLDLEKLGFIKPISKAEGRHLLIHQLPSQIKKGIMHSSPNFRRHFKSAI